MAQRGRKPKPTALKVLEGNPGKRPLNLYEPAPEGKWDTLPEPEEIQAYMAFIAALCAMAKQAKRVTSYEKEVESEKFSFRVWLLRMGFKGNESKAQRAILLKRLSGNAAFPNKTAADAFSAAQKAKRDAAKAAAAGEEEKA